MLQLIRHTLLLFALLLIGDRLIGALLENIFYKQYHGDDHITMHVLDSVRCEILIMGSSRASHHYISDSLEHYTGKTVFNGGRDNMGIHYTYAVTEVLLKRHQPEFIVFDIIPYNYIKGSQDAVNYLSTQTTTLLPFASRHPDLYAHIEHISKLEMWKGKAIKTYAYNSLIGTIIQNAFTPYGHQQQKGYELLHGEINPRQYTRQLYPYPDSKAGIDSSAFNLLEKTLIACRKQGVTPVLCFSPCYFPYQHEQQIIQAFREMAIKYSCALYDFSTDTTYTKKAAYFYDELHLSHKGAIRFTREVAEKLNQELDRESGLK
jgi:hypothetical protein